MGNSGVVMTSIPWPESFPESNRRGQIELVWSVPENVQSRYTSAPAVVMVVRDPDAEASCVTWGKFEHGWQANCVDRFALLFYLGGFETL